MPFVLHLIVITIGLLTICLLLFAFVPWFSPVVPKMLQMIRASGTVPTRS